MNGGLERIVALRPPRVPRGRARLRLAGVVWTPARCATTVARSSPGAAVVSRLFEQSRCSGVVPRAVVHRRRRGTGADARRSGLDGGVSRSACSASSAAAAGAPRACAVRAASSRSRGDVRLGSAVASARWRARSSADGTTSASRACRDLRRAGVWRATTAEPSSGCVNLTSLAVELENPRVERLGEPRVEASAERRFQERDGRVGQGCDGVRNLARLGAEAVDSRVQELVEARRNRELVAGRERAASSLERGSQLEHEEGVAARGLPEPDQGRSWKACAEAYVEQLVGRAEAEAGDFDRLEPILGNGAAEPVRDLAADCQQRGDRLTIQAGERIAEGRERGSVQPLDVVDRDTEWTVGGDQSQRREEGGGHGALVGVDLSVAEQQGGLESPPLDRWQLGGGPGARRRAGRPAPRTRTGSRHPRVERTGFGSRGSTRPRFRPARASSCRFRPRRAERRRPEADRRRRGARRWFRAPRPFRQAAGQLWTREQS